MLHGVQLWLALPEAARFVDPTFRHYAPDPMDLDGAPAPVFLGGLFGVTSPLPAHTTLPAPEMPRTTLRPRG